MRNTHRQIQRNTHWKIVYFHMCVYAYSLVYLPFSYAMRARAYNRVCGYIDTWCVRFFFRWRKKKRTSTRTHIISCVCIRNARQCRWMIYHRSMVTMLSALIFCQIIVILKKTTMFLYHSVRYVNHFYLHRREEWRKRSIKIIHTQRHGTAKQHKYRTKWFK